MSTTIFYTILLTCFLVSKNDIYEGKVFPGFVVYISNIDDAVIVGEIGGTSIKMGGDYIILFRKIEKIDNINTLASSQNKKCYLYKDSSCYYFQYEGIKGKRKFKLKNVKKSSKIKKIRYGIFQMYYYNKYNGDYNLKEPNQDFKNFLNSPYEYLVKK